MPAPPAGLVLHLRRRVDPGIVIPDISLRPADCKNRAIPLNRLNPSLARPAGDTLPRVNIPELDCPFGSRYGDSIGSVDPPNCDHLQATQVNLGLTQLVDIIGPGKVPDVNTVASSEVKHVLRRTRKGDL